MNVEILPEPTDEEREAILAALEAVDGGTSNVSKPWQREAEDP